jgi:hypothetical protein
MCDTEYSDTSKDVSLYYDDRLGSWIVLQGEKVCGVGKTVAECMKDYRRYLENDRCIS